MVITIIIKDDNGKQVKSTDFYAKPDENWEETSYRIGCKDWMQSSSRNFRDYIERYGGKAISKTR
jgi:hypothetical protein